MTVRTEDKREVHIENHRLDQKICQDLKKYDILFIQAPIGWGKHTYLADFSVAYAIQCLLDQTACLILFVYIFYLKHRKHPLFNSPRFTQK